MNYTYLTEDDRYDIYERKERGESLTKIAAFLGRNKSTISRELRRNTCGELIARNQAHESSQERLKKPRGRKSLPNTAMIQFKEFIEEGFSPSQASGRALHEGYALVSHQTLYKGIYVDKAAGGSLWKNLRCSKKRRKRYGSARQRRGKIPKQLVAWFTDYTQKPPHKGLRMQSPKQF